MRGSLRVAVASFDRPFVLPSQDDFAIAVRADTKRLIDGLPGAPVVRAQHEVLTTCEHRLLRDRDVNVRDEGRRRRCALESMAAGLFQRAEQRERAREYLRLWLAAFE